MSRPWPDFRPGPLGALKAWWRRRVPRRVDDITFVPPASSHQQEFETPLASAVYGLDFQLRLTVVWRLDLATGLRHNSPKSAAIHHVLQRAKEISGKAMLVHHAALQVQLGDELATERQVPGTHVWARAEQVKVTVGDEDLEMARKHIELLRNSTFKLAERDVERAEIRYLRDEVLTDVGTATIWWLQRNGYQVQEAVKLADHLAELVKIAQREPATHWAESLVSSVERAMPELEDVHRKDLRLHLAKALSVYGGARVAAEFADQVGLPAGEPHRNGHV
ncbi:hypothetical protein V1227_24895 [Lentzea sp. DG1S-22]|uniref:hypothetical protein n=1 Tax=Lentzea sp. DG1S-22 TaxID=3108822 RepID=UPI002E770A1A|nr:hypothetical protein [Lentzea sp. DG1S-22]WVH78309.1 hypothetical protein V1227_24895 [Lentzea sp. DG1S-22]